MAVQGQGRKKRLGTWMDGGKSREKGKGGAGGG